MNYVTLFGGTVRGDSSISASMRTINVGISDLPSDLKAVHEYWDALRGERMAPSWSEFDLISLPANLLPTTMVVDVYEPLEKSIFRYWGSNLTLIHGADMTSRHPYDLSPPEFGRQVLEDHRAVIEKRAPMGWHYSFLAVGGYMHSHTTIRLPLSNNGSNVNHILIVVDFSREALDLIRKTKQNFAEAMESGAE
ncbi:MAG: PAS domain-containing protein [Rhodospirillales bacterium]|nr:PAS domain-containing protein [Rhodospirillales bacterium]MBO6788218.1 PAS domain-containing protein [Rhodospirillales bacterium]